MSDPGPPDVTPLLASFTSVLAATVLLLFLGMELRWKADPPVDPLPVASHGVPLDLGDGVPRIVVGLRNWCWDDQFSILVQGRSTTHEEFRERLRCAAPGTRILLLAEGRMRWEAVDSVLRVVAQSKATSERIEFATTGRRLP
jgi:hypothetical protein